MQRTSARRKHQREARRAHPRRALPEVRPAGVPAGREDEASTVILLGTAWDGLSPQDGRCAGPLLIHIDGSFECHGTCGDQGESALRTWHDLDPAVWPCDNTEGPPVAAVFNPCGRCSSSPTRRAQAAAAARPGSLEDVPCPTCGGGELGEVGRCGSCGTQFASCSGGPGDDGEGEWFEYPTVSWTADGRSQPGDLCPACT